eukprot:scaffold237_cov421-Prasinococcus_capsulatus_cf.AAC.12
MLPCANVKPLTCLGTLRSPNRGTVGERTYRRRRRVNWTERRMGRAAGLPRRGLRQPSASRVLAGGARKAVRTRAARARQPRRCHRPASERAARRLGESRATPQRPSGESGHWAGGGARQMPEGEYPLAGSLLPGDHAGARRIAKTHASPSPPHPPGGGAGQG